MLVLQAVAWLVVPQCQPPSSSKKKICFLKARVTERQRFSIYCCTLQKPAMASAGPGQKQKPETPSRSSTREAGTPVTGSGHPPLPSRAHWQAARSEAEQRGLNQCSDMGDQHYKQQLNSLYHNAGYYFYYLNLPPE